MEKLAEFKKPCSDLFLYLGPQWQTDIPTTEEGEGAIAYWGEVEDSSNPGDPGDPPEKPPKPPDPPKENGASIRVKFTAYYGGARYVPVLGPPDVPPSGTPLPSTEEISLKVGFVAKLGPGIYGHDSGQTHLFVTNFGAGFSFPLIAARSFGTMNGYYVCDVVDFKMEFYNGNDWNSYPPESDDDDDDSDDDETPPRNGVIVKELRGGEEHTVKAIPRDVKPQNAEFKCESCEQNCVLMVRSKADGTAKGICICKDGLSEEEEKVACEKCRTELLRDLPGIITTKLKAELLPGLKKETKDETKAEVSQEIKGSFAEEIGNRVPESLPASEYEEKGATSNLVGNVKSALLKDEDFLDAIWTAVAAEFAKPENQEDLFQSLTGDKIADRIIAITETEKLTALKNKLGITAPTNNNNNDPNKLTANGFEWTIAKVADKVETVSYVAKDSDSISALINSGSAIINALKAKFSGKNFTIESSSSDPNTKTYTYNINEL